MWSMAYFGKKTDWKKSKLRIFPLLEKCNCTSWAMWTGKKRFSCLTRFFENKEAAKTWIGRKTHPTESATLPMFSRFLPIPARQGKQRVWLHWKSRKRRCLGLSTPSLGLFTPRHGVDRPSISFFLPILKGQNVCGFAIKTMQSVKRIQFVAFESKRTGQIPKELEKRNRYF